ncbi:hypothetical protein Are01nite_26540 [Actinoplanes regularis]|nr:hypothetical protein Are01nite_26540 [Actinoplanes regularis]
MAPSGPFGWLEAAVASRVRRVLVLGVVPIPDLTDYWAPLLSGPAMAAAASVAREALRQRGETKREELRQNGETARTALTGELPKTKAIEPPSDEEKS